MRVVREFLQFDARPVIAVAEMDHSGPYFKKPINIKPCTLQGSKMGVYLLAASVYFVANATKLHPITTPAPAHHNPTMALAQNNGLSFAATAPA